MSRNSEGPNPHQLRQRRAQIIQDKVNDNRELKELEKVIMMGWNTRTGHSLQTSILIVTAVIVTVGSILHYRNNDYFNRLMNRRNVYPTFYFGTQYPKGVILERDLPRFFRTYSIATPENEIARKAVQRVCRSRSQLKRRAGIITSVLKAWDESNVHYLLSRGFCGTDFDRAYRQGSQERKDDLLMWCLLATQIVEGYFMESVEMIDTALFLTRKRGMVVQKELGSVPGGKALSNAFYLHPRTNTTNVEWIPSKALAWIISNPEDVLGAPADARYLFQRFLHDLVIAQGNEDDFLVLEEVCQDHRPSRAIAVHCPDGDGSNDCCYFVVPEKYGGNFESLIEEAGD